MSKSGEVIVHTTSVKGWCIMRAERRFRFQQILSFETDVNVAFCGKRAGFGGEIVPTVLPHRDKPPSVRPGLSPIHQQLRNVNRDGTAVAEGEWWVRDRGGNPYHLIMKKTAVSERDRVLKEVRAALEREPRVNLHKFPVEMEFSDGVLTLEGEVEHIAAKKLSLEWAIAVQGVTGIVDRLHVTPAMRMGDGAILDAVRDALLQETTLKNCSLHMIRKGQLETIRAVADEPHGSIRVSVNAGVVLLDDHVTGLMQKRLAGVLAWWVPGSRDVINGMEVVPEQPDSDEEMAKAVRIVLKKDPFVNEERIRVSVRKSVVMLEGDVPSMPQREMVEFDAWYVFGVDKVVNNLEVRP
jgi:osmotically-inducible protein OsmY